VNWIHVLAPGLLTTVQDLGRFGYAQFGISASGAADSLALRAANLLVGNAENAPALEMTLTGGEFAFEQPATIALTGADFVSGLPLWQPIPIRAGERVRCPHARDGARCYLAVRGGLSVPLVMESASVHVTTGVGGRPLRRGDTLAIGDAAVRLPRKPARDVPRLNPPACLRVTLGQQAGDFGDELYRSAYTVSEESNRMGIRLKGPPLAARAVTARFAAIRGPLANARGSDPSQDREGVRPSGGHMITEGVPLGAVQAPPDGQPIVLFVEHQTTGGYPKPANVISADFWRLGQLRPRNLVSFERVTMPAAIELLRDQEAWLYSL
jgi:antagonist of KipI